jgi:hypothetical protein
VKQRFYIIVGAIAIVVIIAVAAAAANSSTQNGIPNNNPQFTPTPKPEILTFTVSAGVGAEQIRITNLNIPATIILTQSDFPATFNCNTGDVLTFDVTPKDGYTFNAWLLDDGTWQSKNPLTWKTAGSFSMEAVFLINDVEVTQP